MSECTVHSRLPPSFLPSTGAGLFPIPFVPCTTTYNYEWECAALQLHWITFEPVAAHIANSRPLEQRIPLYGRSITRVGSSSKIFLSDQPSRRSGQGWRTNRNNVSFSATKKMSEMFQFYSQISEWVLRHGNELGATRKFRSPWLGFVPQHISHHSLSLLRTHFNFHTNFRTLIFTL